MARRWSLLLVLSIPLPSQAAEDRPNILMLVAEDMGLEVGAFGDPVAVTPNLDRLANQGVRFPNTFTTAGVCAPSRVALITGQHQIHVGGQHMRSSGFEPAPYLTVPPVGVKAFPELLRKAGYYTFTSTKLDYQFSGVFPGQGPFTIWDEEASNYTLAWQNKPADRPFFALYNYFETHESGVFPRTGPPRNPTHAQAALLHRFLHQGGADVVSPADVLVPPYYPDTVAVRTDIARHYNNIYTMDLRVGEILEQLESDGLADNTIVIWTTDNGTGLPRCKRELFDSGIQVPMIVRWPPKFLPPDVEPHSIDERMISFVDLAPTILQMAGVPAPSYLHGRPFVGSLGTERRQYVFASRDRTDEVTDRQRASRDARYKYIRNYLPGPGGVHLEFRDTQDIMWELWDLLEQDLLSETQRIWFALRPAEELYDTWSDPHEVNNLANERQYSDVLHRMSDALDQWLGQIQDQSDVSEAELSEMFWPDGIQPKTATPEIRYLDGRVEIRSETPGASIGVRINEGNWQVYCDPLLATPGSLVRARAVRYGWQSSDPASLRLRAFPAGASSSNRR